MLHIFLFAIPEQNSSPDDFLYLISRIGHNSCVRFEYLRLKCYFERPNFEKKT